jgi:hypothetical protein
MDDVGTGRARALIVVAALATLLGAALGFAVQPLVSRLLLPRLGGGAAVWNTTLVFFQATLLLGYLVTHLTSTRLGPRSQVGVHLAILLIGVAVLPISVPRNWVPPQTGNPAFWLLGVLALVVGLPYLAVATTSPLVQRWFSVGAHRQSSDPYFLYAISNIGSFAGLLAVPLWLDRSFRLADQARWWAVGYIAFTALCVTVVVLARPDRGGPEAGAGEGAGPGAAFAVDRAVADAALAHTAIAVVELAPVHDPAAPTSSITRSTITRSTIRRLTILRWIVLAFIPSSLILGVTTHLTTDVASVPLLWVIPLGLYLLTHIVAFSRFTVPAPILGALAGSSVALAVASSFVDYLVFPEKLAPHLAALFFVGLACHARLAQERPPVERLTAFYVAISTGGVAGGAFNALIAPVVFTRVIEYPLVLIAAVLMIGGIGVAGNRGRRFDRWGIDFASLLVAIPVGAATVWLARRMTDHPGRLAAALALVVAMLVARRRGILAAVVVTMIAVLALRDTTSAGIRFERGFYGAIRVEEADGFHQLVHGTTIHGYQFIDSAKHGVPTSYYGRPGPLGQLITSIESARGNVGRFGVVGLGVGTVASYVTAKDSITYYEIDPIIVKIAEDRSLFTYLSDAKGPVDIVLGDGRRQLERSQNRYDLLVIDAFSSDAIPVHLLTTEALRTYRDRLAPGGMLAVHISNRYLDLEPVVGAISDDLGMAAIAGHFVADETQEAEGTTGSDWIILAAEPSTLDGLRGSLWAPVRREADVRAWTDDRADLLSVLIR